MKNTVFTCSDLEGERYVRIGEVQQLVDWEGMELVTRSVARKKNQSNPKAEW